MQRNGILAAGSYIVDHVKMIDAWPPQDALATIVSKESSNGGGPYNLSKDIARFFPNGAPFPLAAAGLVGDDADGRWILADCQQHHIDTTQLNTTDQAPTSYTDVMTVQADGRRTFFHQRGANALFSEQNLDLEKSTARIFYLGYLLLLDTLDQVTPEGTRASALLADARSQGFLTVVDLVSAEGGNFIDIVSPSLPHIDVLLTNEFEASRLSGIDLHQDFSAKNALAAAHAILDMGVQQRVIIHAPLGAAAVDRELGDFTAGSVSMPDDAIRGAVGAGDAFAAGIAYGLHENLSIEESLTTASCIAASCLLHPTPSGGILPLDDCLALGEQWGFRDF
ncbi:MAG: carbohydrate kinase family protein [Verrucomicrobiales bacterium]|nr:carbohydrate kinase family protein [Verrucomicrobiales bacterium]